MFLAAALRYDHTFINAREQLLAVEATCAVQDAGHTAISVLVCRLQVKPGCKCASAS